MKRAAPILLSFRIVTSVPGARAVKRANNSSCYNHCRRIGGVVSFAGFPGWLAAVRTVSSGRVSGRP